MLKSMRKKGFAKKVIWFIAIVIIISFGFLGTAYLLTDSGPINYAGKIFGKKISIEDFNKVYKNTRIQAIREHNYDLNKVRQMNLDAQTWDRMILLHEAKKKKIKITNEAVVKAIEEDDLFKRNDQFDVLIYNAILRNIQIRPRDYEENVRDNLKIDTLFKQATSDVVISEEEVFQEYKNQNEKVQVSYVLAPSESFKDEVAADEPEIREYYENNKPEFRVPPSINVQYLTFEFPKVEEPKAEEPEVSELEEGSEADTTDKDDQIEQEKGLVREKADKVFEELLINPDMEAVAKQNNMTVQASGYFSREQPNLALGWSYDLFNRIFQMEENEVSEPFENTNGLTIAQIKERKDSYIPDFDTVRKKAKEAVLKQKSKEVAREKAGEYLRTLKRELGKSKVKDFPKVAKTLGLEIHQTPVFHRRLYLPQIGTSRDFQEEAFKLTEDNNISGVVEIEKGYCILHLDNYIPVDENEFEKVKEELSKPIFEKKQKEAFEDFVMQLRFKADLVNNVSKLRQETQ